MERYKDKSVSAEERAEDLLDRMSFEEKAAQLTGYNPAFWSKDDLEIDYPYGVGQVSSFAGVEKESIDEWISYQKEIQDKIMTLSPHRIPALFHVETLCGVMLLGAMSFPSGIGQASSFDPSHQKEAGELIGKQARAFGTTQAFAPVLDISRDPRFGRQGETYGEDPCLAAALGSAYAEGLQRGGVIATAKHFVGYHDSQGGIHAAACDIPERLLREVYAKPFQAAISEAGMQGIMPCYSSINAEPVSGSKKILTTLLREEMGFEGIVVSDYSSIQEMHERQYVGNSYAEAGLRAIKAGMDQELPSPKCYTLEALNQWKDDPEFMRCLNQSVRRVLLMKFKIGLFESPYAAEGELIKQTLADQEIRNASLKSARESLVLVKNGGILPLTKKKQKIAVIGYHGNALRAMFGGYTYMSMTESHLGAVNTMAGFEMDMKTYMQQKREKYLGTVVEKEHPEAENYAKLKVPGIHNLLEQLRVHVPDAEFSYAYGYPFAGNDCSNHEEALTTAKEADIILMTVGGKYGTGSTASIGEGIDAVDINLPYCQETFIEKAAKLGKPLVLVHFGGRPISSDGADQYADAILEAWNPGEWGSRAICEVIFGDYNPGGKMPVTTPYCAGQIPIYYNHPNGSSYHQNTISAFTRYMDCPHEPRYYFGHGLSYTSFEYHDFQCESKVLKREEKLRVTLEIENSGMRDGDEVVQIYVRDCYASMVRPVVELAGFYRVHLKAGQKKKLNFTMEQSQFAFMDENMEWKVEAGEMELMAGSSVNDIRLKEKVNFTETYTVEGKSRGFYAQVEEQ